MPVAPAARRPQRIMARTILFGTSAILAAGLLTWSPATTTGWNQGAAEGTLWQLLNGARINNGLAPIQQHSTLLGIARWRSADMLARDYFSHTIAGCGCLVYAYYDSNGVLWDWAGENIGWNQGLDDTGSAVRVHEQFMNSPGHRANVLTPSFTHGAVGAAAADNQMFQGYVGNTRMFTELFLQPPAVAAPAPAPAPAPALAPAPRPSGGGGGATQPAAQPVAAEAPPPEPTPKQMAVDAPRRPSSTAGIDGVATVVIERSGRNVAARLAADDALGIHGGTNPAVDEVPPVAEEDRPMEVAAAAAPAQAGLFESIVGALLGFLFG